MYLVRKVNKAKWDVSDASNGAPVNADAITNCLATKQNTLSFWKIVAESDVDEAVLAIAAANQNLDTIDVVVVPVSAFIERELEIVESPGKTPCLDLVNSHRDLARLNALHLMLVSEVIIEKVRASQVKRYNLTALRALLTGAIIGGRVRHEDLHVDVQRKLNYQGAI